MKFGKRLLAEAARKWAPKYLDYKLLKRSIKEDCANADALGSCFCEAMTKELAKVGSFYNEREQQLQKLLAHIEQLALDVAAPNVRRLCLDAQELTKFAVLNYMAVIKAVKKRNKRLREVCGDRVVPLMSFDVLQHQPFFYSRALAQVATSAAILDERLKLRTSRHDITREYECPICLELLHAPVVLTCCHRFCWGCITTYCAGVLHRHCAWGQPALPPSKECESDGAESSHAAESSRFHAIALSQLHPSFAALLESYESSVAAHATAFDCPMCRRTQILDVEHLTVDHNLNAFVEQLRARRSCEKVPEIAADLAEASQLIAAQPVPAAKDIAAEPETLLPSALPPPPPEPVVCSGVDAPLLSPQAPHLSDKLCIVLDLDGTLISSFAPRRAPRLPDYMRAHLVGVGSKLNPHGVLVVERPGLNEFLTAAQSLGELVVFTAGLPEYAAPIISAIDPTGEFFGDRVIFREGTTASPHYPCVKDLSRLGRNLAKTLLVDDTPLAFLQQPENGVPVMSFRGDPDDNLLQDAVLPLLQSLALEGDIRDKLSARFGMAAWFTSNGFPVPPRNVDNACEPHATAGNPSSAVTEPPHAAEPASDDAAAEAVVAAAVRRMNLASGSLLVCDFDSTLIDCNCGERITEVLAPELLPMLATTGHGGCGLSMLNSVLSEMRDRGIGRERLLSELQALGRDMPPACLEMLSAVRAAGASTLILSNANVAFVTNVLHGAGAQVPVGIVANGSEFVRARCNERRACMTQTSDSSAVSAAKLPSHKLHVSPCQPESAPHRCPHCPSSLCKGMYIRELQARHSRLVLAGDGAENLCAVLHLRREDVALVREGGACAALLAKRSPNGAVPRCKVLHWESHSHLQELAMLSLQAAEE